MSQTRLTEYDKRRIDEILTDTCFQEIGFNGEIGRKVLTEDGYEQLEKIIDSIVKKEKAEVYHHGLVEGKRQAET